jgi:hypothetical protein
MNRSATQSTSPKAKNHKRKPSTSQQMTEMMPVVTHVNLPHAQRAKMIKFLFGNTANFTFDTRNFKPHLLCKASTEIQGESSNQTLISSNFSLAIGLSYLELYNPVRFGPHNRNKPRVISDLLLMTSAVASSWLETRVIS